MVCEVWSDGGEEGEQNDLYSRDLRGWVSLLSYAVGHNDRPLRRLLVIILVRHLLSSTGHPPPSTTFQSKAIDEVANSRRLTIPWITGENSPNCTWAGRQTVSLNVAERNYSRGSFFSLFSFEQLVAVVLATTHSSYFPLVVWIFLFFSLFLFPRKRERKRVSFAMTCGQNWILLCLVIIFYLMLPYRRACVLFDIASKNGRGQTRVSLSAKNEIKKKKRKLRERSVWLYPPLSVHYLFGELCIRNLRPYRSRFCSIRFFACPNRRFFPHFFR